MVKQRISIKDVNIAVNGKIVGGAEEATFTVARDNEEAYEAGTYLPVEIVGGKFHISGSLTRAFVDVDLLNELMPKQAIPASVTINGSVISGKLPLRSVTVFGAVFDSADINSLAIDGYAKNALPFKAVDWRWD
jgi:hypothetical protein